MNADLPTSPHLSRRLVRWVGAALLLGALAACGSNVKLDDVPVEDRTPGAAQDGSAAGASSGVDQRSVAGVNTQSELTVQPANLARLVYFDYDSFTIRDEFASLLEQHARFLNQDKRRRVVLEGHTDERGGREYNLALGQKRAEAVRRALGLLGVGDEQLEAVSFGEEKPANAALSEDAFAQNRRVELSYR